MRLLLGNLVFGALLWGWYLMYGADHHLLVRGVLLTCASFTAGTIMGYFCRPVPKPPAARRARAGQPDAQPTADHLSDSLAALMDSHKR